ncbi:MAG: hypothetical protein K5694_00460, partial [Bacilli bacterium]|nr:hypothetical protein [Bacilli bacterium]
MKTITKRIIIYSSISVSAIGIGLFVGFQLRSSFKPDIVVYEVDDAALEAHLPDKEAMYKRYIAVKNSGGDYFKRLTVPEIVNVSYRLLGEQSSFKAVGVGAALASGITQEIESTVVYKDGISFEESNSYSNSTLVNIKIFNRGYEENGTTTTYWGSDRNYASHEKKTYTNEEYKEMMGRNLSSPSPYIVSDSTLLTEKNISGDKEPGIYPNDDGTYDIEVELDNYWGVATYVMQMKTISDLKYYPTFDFCHFTLTVDS